MLREIAHYAALLVGVLFSVVVAVFGMSFGVIASHLRHLDFDFQTEVRDLFGQISDLKQKSHGDPHQALKQAKSALRKAIARSRHLRLNRWLLSLWGALYIPSLLLLSAFVLFIFTKVGILSDWEITIFSVAVILTVYSLIHLALVVDLVHQAVLLPEPPDEALVDLKPELDVVFVDDAFSRVIILAQDSEFLLRFFFRNRGEGQANGPSINVLVPDTFTHIDGTMYPQFPRGERGRLYFRRMTEPLEGKTNYDVTIGKVKTPAEPGDFNFRVTLHASNSRIIRKTLKVLVK